METITKGFYDLCVPWKDDDDYMVALLTELYDVGYRTVAIEQTFDHTKCNRKTNEIFPEPIDLTNIRYKFQQKLKILSRLTIVYSQNVISHDMNTSSNIKKFNLLCGVPINESAAQHACSTFSGDMIGMVCDDSMKVCLIPHKYYVMAARRGMSFEIQYGPVVRNSNHRKDVIIVAQNIVSHRKAGSIVITGGALNSFQVRSPYDISNLGLIFGLSEEQSKSAISNVCRTIILRAEGRRYGKTVILAKNVPQSSSEEENGTSDNGDDSDDDESMDEGHPAKRPKMT